MIFRELDLVVLTEDVDGESAGTIGTVVAADAARDTYGVEVNPMTGRVVTVAGDQLRHH
jgi:hypothetical protein